MELTSGRISWHGINLFKKINVYWLISCASPLILFFVWYVACRLQLFPDQILVPPENVWLSFINLIQSGELYLHLKDSLFRLFAGFSIGATAAIAFGIVYATNRHVKDYFSLIFNVLYQIPIFVLIPIFILIFGIGETFKILLIIKACFFPVALAMIEAVEGVPKQYMELSQVYQLKLKNRVKYIILPSVMPPLISSLRIALGRAWLILVAVELLAAGTGIGQMMELGRQMLRLDIVMVGVFITGLIGFVLDKSLRQVEQRFIQYKQQ
ncbi:ABC transporter permease subunit [Acinetobacter sp. ANC 5378]|uniref:ABC transporter permease n=1 Tax=Acinetobacter sp. ANC 5378 TaxID=2731249 RepID=UPI0014904492|nr:ABC transporter permease [Acinetobacter sp. ANC 5378]